jgi:sulfhydrogenase subunit gamma (sulfur reductase)
MTCACDAKRDVYLPQVATVLKNDAVTALEAHFELALDAGRPLGHMPGQFVEVSVPGFGEAPISISSAPNGKDSFELVVRKMGNVSGALHRLETGAKVGIRGPFGTHFPVDGTMQGRDVLFVCGGIGLVPVRSAIQYVLANRADYGAVTILIGTKSPAERLFIDEVAEWAARDDVTLLETVDRGDDSWTGHVGVITTLMPGLALDSKNTVVVVCGPPVMYKFVLFELDKVAITPADIYVSLERRMKCGVGKCGHCQINGLYVCQDGPVFRFADVMSAREAIQ